MKKKLIKVMQWTRNVIVFLFAFSLFMVILYKYVPVYYTPQMLFSSQVSRQWRPLPDISQHLVQAVVASEDNYFLVHNGFSFFQFEPDSTDFFKSVVYKENRTLSQQTAETVFLLPNHTWIGKSLETYFTILIEFVWGKKRIMEVYLNTKEMGDGVFGAEAIAGKNFNKTASQLSAQEAALITTAFPDPKELDSGEPTSEMLIQQIKIVYIMSKIIPVEMGKINNEDE
jgi:monofunctional biosynthetic peptidoglycan transglycosylase